MKDTERPSDINEPPDDIAELIGQPQYPDTADFCAELGYGWNTLAATENGNPLYWDETVADALTAGRILPLSTLSIWMRPHRWTPGATSERVALQAHFDLKARLGLPEAIMSDNTVTFWDPVRPGDTISHHQVLRSVSGPKTTRLGSGRFWVIDVEYHNQHGSLVGVESYTGFGYKRPGTERSDSADPADPAGSVDPHKGIVEHSSPESPTSAIPGTDAPTSGTDKRLRRSDTAGYDSGRSDAAGSDAAWSNPQETARLERLADKSDPGWPGPQETARRAEVHRHRAGTQSDLQETARRVTKPDPTHDQVRVGDTLPELSHDVTATTVVLGALASRDWRPMHHDYRFATERNGTRDIFLNTPNQLAWFERTVTDWTGPKGRLGRMSFRMRDPVFPGERMTISATVTAVPTDEVGCGWAELKLTLNTNGRVCTTGTARVALPTVANDNPWLRSGDLWRP